MSQPEEFSLESVRQLMLAHGGRVTNHSLVKSYRQWLTDPQLKDQARAQFKVSITLGALEQSCRTFLTSSRARYRYLGTESNFIFFAHCVPILWYLTNY